MARWYGVASGGDEIALKLIVVMALQFYECTKMPEMYTLNRWTTWCVNSISIKLIYIKVWCLPQAVFWGILTLSLFATKFLKLFIKHCWFWSNTWQCTSAPFTCVLPKMLSKVKISCCYLFPATGKKIFSCYVSWYDIFILKHRDKSISACGSFFFTFLIDKFIALL